MHRSELFSQNLTYESVSTGFVISMLSASGSRGEELATADAVGALEPDGPVAPCANPSATLTRTTAHTATASIRSRSAVARRYGLPMTAAAQLPDNVVGLERADRLRLGRCDWI